MAHCSKVSFPFAASPFAFCPAAKPAVRATQTAVQPATAKKRSIIEFTWPPRTPFAFPVYKTRLQNA
jgi:hypothetical protein